MGHRQSYWFSFLMGVLLVFFGAVILLDRLGIETDMLWDFWPVVVIAVGVGVIFSRR